MAEVTHHPRGGPRSPALAPGISVSNTAEQEGAQHSSPGTWPSLTERQTSPQGGRGQAGGPGSPIDECKEVAKEN